MRRPGQQAQCLDRRGEGLVNGCPMLFVSASILTRLACDKIGCMCGVPVYFLDTDVLAVPYTRGVPVGFVSRTLNSKLGRTGPVQTRVR